MRKLEKVLQKLEEEKLLINLKKCAFMQEDIICLGFMILVDGLRMDPKKVKTILEWPTPENVGKVRSFHVLASFY